jgi:PKD repeat protein
MRHVSRLIPTFAISVLLITLAYVLAIEASGDDTALIERSARQGDRESAVPVRSAAADAGLAGASWHDGKGAMAAVVAACGAFYSISGTLPFAIHLDVVNGVGEGREFTYLDTNAPVAFCWDDGGSITCMGGGSDPYHGWLNLNFIYNREYLSATDPLNRTFDGSLSSAGCGSDPDVSYDDGLYGWATRGACPYPYPMFSGAPGTLGGDFIHGYSGAQAATLMRIHDTFGGYSVYVPVFDRVITRTYAVLNLPQAEDPVAPGEGGGWPCPGAGGHCGFFYHVVGFAAMEVLGPPSHKELTARFIGSFLCPPQELRGVHISGPAVGLTGVVYSYTATVDPITATQPITYVWRVAGQPSVTGTGGLSNTFALTWAVDGPQAITVTAANEVSSVTGTYPITIYVQAWADFTASPASGVAPLTVTFTNHSTGDYDAVLWRFGDGLTSTVDSPSHIYAAAGVYTVSLVVSSPGGSDALTRTHYIAAYQAVQAGFGASPTVGIAPLEVTFTNHSTGDYDAVLWRFGDGLTSTVDSPSHTYSAAGVYTVSLAVRGPGGSDVLTRTHYIAAYQAVQAGFGASPTVGVAPLEVTFSNLSTGDYDASLWRFGDGLTSTLDSPSHIYAAAGVYTVSLAVSGPGGSDALTRTHYITAYQAVQAGFGASPTVGIAPLEVTFSNLSTGDYDAVLWRFGDGLTSTVESPSHIYAGAGVYTVSLAVSGPGGSDVLTCTHYITVGEESRIYFPVVVRNASAQ